MYKILILAILLIPSTSHALSFDGTDDYVNVGTVSSLHASTSDLTISAWIKPTNVSVGSRYIVINSNIGGGVIPWGLELNSTAGRVSYLQNGTGGGTVRVVGATTLQVDKWYHVVATRKFESTLVWPSKVYVNGVLDGSGTVARAGTTNQTVAIGRLGLGNTNFFQGEIADVRIYNRQLSDQEIKALYRGYSTYSGLLVRWLLDGNALPYVPSMSLIRANGFSFNGVLKRGLPPALKIN